MSKQVTRRRFLQSSAWAGISVITLPNAVKGAAANEKLRFACIGVGGRAGAGVGPGLGQHLVAVAEVDTRRNGKKLDSIKAKSPDTKVYTDYRQLFDKHQDLDAVWVGTPDHNHFPAAARALHLGAGVYCEKPLTWSMGEARELARLADEKKVPTQMGNQGHSSEGIRLIVEYLRGGALGAVTEVNAHSAKGWGGGRYRDADKPDGLDWNAWLGPAPDMPFKAGPHPDSWRKFIEYGTGTLGDMGIHTMDGAVWGLKLHEAPSFTVEAIAGEPTPPGHPVDAEVHWHFPARGDMPPVKLTWHQGKLSADFPPEVADEKAMKMTRHGTFYRGEKGYMVSNAHCNAVRLVPEAFQKEVGKPEQLIPRVGNHARDWLRAFRQPDGPLPNSHFGYAGPLTEIVNAGVVAWRVGEKLTYDMKAGKFTNSDEANGLLWRKPREGWTACYPT